MKSNILKYIAGAAILSSLLSCESVDDAASEAARQELIAGWQTPPQEARPLVWWHWMNGNITKDGIKKDLEWMKRIGIGGFHHFDASLGTPQIVEKRLVYMDEGWKDAFAYATRLADEFGFEMSIASAPGWSATGGPWVSPNDAMKKLVWKEMDVEGGRQLSVALPEPDKSTGAVNNGQNHNSQWQPSKYQHYEDIAVIAVPLKESLLPDEKSVVNLTNMRDNKGILNWSAPEGKWKIYRFGWSLTGKTNHPAPPEATGLEVDKLDPIAWKKYFATYLDMYKDASKELIGQRGIQYVLTDSYEAGLQTWTPAMFEEFQQHRGYDLHNWLPVLAGAVIGSEEKSEAFLRDWEKTIGELIVDNYTLLTEIAQKDYGMKGRYSEAHEAGRVFWADGMAVKSTAQVPMSAMWCSAPWLQKGTDGEINRTVYKADDRESASVAHLYGQNIAAAESMTAWEFGSGYNWCPERLKKIADIELAEGINRFVIHESAHQPVDDKVPGLSLGGIGQWFNRHDTWAEQASAWVSYLSRSSYMMQQGKNVADVLVYYGENANITSLYMANAPDVPNGYNFDYCNSEVLCDLISCDEQGRLVSKASGTVYRLLWLDKNVEYMSIDVLRKIAELAKAGAIVGGEKPQHPFGLIEDKDEFDRLAEEIWSSKQVTTGLSMETVLKDNGIEPDFLDSAANMKFVHRSLPHAEIYWVNKPDEDEKKVTVSFRVSGKKPQVWHPETGLIEDVSYRMTDARTEVCLDLVKDDAVFVVFCGKGEREYNKPVEATLSKRSVSEPWNVKFQAGRGAPAEATFKTLASLSDNEDSGIKYFSGTASYTNSFSLEAIEEGTKQILNLGKVKNIAEVFVNGQNAGIVWKEPFVVDISAFVHEGENKLEVQVTNMWVNRLIGDVQPTCKKRITYTDANYYKPTDPLEESGLIGPVQVITMSNQLNKQ